MHIESTLVKKTITWGSMVLLGAVLGISLQYASAAWTTAPAGIPPSGNVNGPITTSSDIQTKAGKLETAGTAVGDSNNTVVTLGYLKANYVNAAGPGQPVRGGHYGGCYQQKDPWDNAVVGWAMAWPITSCPTGPAPARPTCANDYSLIVLAQSQGNTGANGLQNGYSRYDDTLDTMWTTWACAKN